MSRSDNEKKMNMNKRSAFGKHNKLFDHAFRFFLVCCRHLCLFIFFPCDFIWLGLAGALFARAKSVVYRSQNWCNFVLYRLYVYMVHIMLYWCQQTKKSHHHKSLESSKYRKLKSVKVRKCDCSIGTLDINFSVFSSFPYTHLQLNMHSFFYFKAQLDSTEVCVKFSDFSRQRNQIPIRECKNKEKEKGDPKLKSVAW